MSPTACGLQLISSRIDAIVAFGWIGKLVAIPRRRAGFSLRCGQRALIEILHEVFREEDVECPIDCHAHFLFHPRQFAPINSAPEKPGQESGEVYTEDSCDSRASANRCEQSER